MHDAFKKGFSAELLKTAFAHGFLHEISKTSLEKQGILFIPALMLAAGALTAGASAAGAAGAFRPPGISQSEWFKPRRDIPRIAGEVGGTALGVAGLGTGGLFLRGLSAAGLGSSMMGGGATQAPTAFRPSTISGMRLPGAI